MAGDLLGISVSGLNVSQAGLRTAGHNIANANTEGYSRQSITANAAAPIYAGNAYLGNGTQLADIERQANEYVVSQLRADSSLFHEQQAFLDSVEQLDNMLSNPSIGISESLQRFYSAMQAGADDPTSIASRQLIISEGNSLVERFNSLYDRLDSIEENVNQQLNISVSEANSLLSSIANLNEGIARSSGGQAGEPNDMLDQRDQALLQLSKLVGVRVNRLSDGQVNVSLASGQTLIVGSKVNKFDLINNPDIPGQQELAVEGFTGTSILSSTISGGKMGGLMSFRNEMLARSFNDIGRVAISLSGTLNSLHQQGADLNGEFGDRLFYDINSAEAMASRILYGSDNKPPYNREMSLKVTDSKALSGSDYTVKIEEGSQRFTITRISDGEVVVSNLLTGRTPQNVEFDGLKMTFEGGVFQGGDSFYLQPFKNASREISFDLDDPEALAFSKPIIGQSELGNLGNGSITFGEIITMESIKNGELPIFEVPGQLSPPLMIRFTSETRYDILDNSDPANPVQLDPPIRNQLFIPNQDNALFPTDSGQQSLVAAGERLGLFSANTDTPTENGYPPERFVFSQVIDADTGQNETFKVITAPNASANQIANQLSNVPGVSVNAWTEVNLRDISFTGGGLPSLKVNGQELIEYSLDKSSNVIVSSNVPDPITDKTAFLSYLADRVSEVLGTDGVSVNAVTRSDGGGTYQSVNIIDNLGRDISIAVGNVQLNIDDAVSDSNADGTLDTTTLSDTAPEITVGGRFVISLADGMSVDTVPTPSDLLGDAKGQNAFLGIQAIISGRPQQGDGFTIQFNNDAYGDNRNILSMVGVELAGVLNGGKASLSDLYGLLIEEVGMRTNSSRINAEASEGVMQQSETLRNSISGVNLDEEAANLIKFEQIYSANAQVISVARNVFDRLINSF